MPVKSSSLYEPLLDKDGLDGDSVPAIESEYHPPARERLFSKRASIPIWMIGIVAFLQIATMAVLVRGGLRRTCDYANPQLLYSPAEPLIEYEIVKFRSGLNGEGDDIYSLPPSDEVDAAWADLYNFGVSELNHEQAAQLANVTMQVPHSDDKYVMLLDVFHELHCINMLRMALYPRQSQNCHSSAPLTPCFPLEYYYNDTDPMGSHSRRTHLTHCLGSLRQSVQCSSDISTIVWAKPEGEREGPRFDIIHSCRNFEKIKSWAHDNRGSIYVKEGRISATPDGFVDDMETDMETDMEHHHHGHHHHDGA
ncbi:hypothetical protein H0H92_003937 [Tricholoma furcatifolium]|nr:hypothetical protein H0H92_003937 [Tricholoma furcatifolium]